MCSLKMTAGVPTAFPPGTPSRLGTASPTPAEPQARKTGCLLRCGWTERKGRAQVPDAESRPWPEKVGTSTRTGPGSGAVTVQVCGAFETNHRVSLGAGNTTLFTGGPRGSNQVDSEPLDPLQKLG